MVREADQTDQSQMKGRLNLLLLSLFTLCGIILGQSTQPCGSGWFGSNCQYKCHCMNDAGCGINGTCSGNTKCAKGWFGPACQYVDLAGDVSITAGPIDTYQVLTDDDETTCYGDTAPNHVTVTWNTPYTFTWLRIQGNDPKALTRVTVTFRTVSSQQVDCTHLQSAQVSETTIDIHCDLDQLVTQVLLEGDGVKTLCSLYISAGRNVALKQRANQTSTLIYSYQASLAVDGDWTGSLPSTCTHTDDNDPAPMWSLQFTQPQLIERYVLYNRPDQCQDRLNGFILTSFNQNNVSVFNYKDISTGNLNVYMVTSTRRNEPVLYLNINVTKHFTSCNNKEENMITLCEVELYGDSSCQSGLFGRECEKTCNCPNNGSCFISTGGCPGGCAPGYWGEDCWTACPAKTYGINCNQKCNENCLVNMTAAPAVCDPKNGVCLLGCVNEKECDTGDKKGLIVGVVIGIIAVISIVGVVAAVIFRRQKKSPKNVTESMTVNNKDKTASRISKPKKISRPETSNTKLNIDKGPLKSSSARPYYNLLLEESKPAIPVKELNTFMSTHDTEYFREQYEKVPGVFENLSMEVGLNEENMHKNKYQNICAYDHSRVHLNINPGKHEGDYINASYIEGYKNDEKFIASQGPNKLLLDDFVRMLWEQKPDKIVMLTNLMEEGKSMCEQYWPDNDVIIFGEITVNLLTTHVFADYTIRKLTLTMKDKAPHNLTQFHFTSWANNGVPTTVWALVDFEQRVAAEPTNRPIVIHCSAGVGSTGVFIALRNVIREAEETSEIDFYSALLKLRKDRVYMIQTLEQYIFLHKAAQVAMVCRDTTVAASTISDKIKFLMRPSKPGQTNMEEEFDSVCHLCVENGDHIYDAIDESDNLKDRFSQIVPKENYRPHLTCNLKGSKDYINAVLVPSFTKCSNQLLTQLPMPETILDFCRLVTQFQVSLIVAFEVDTMTFDSTAKNYLPANENEPVICGPFNIATEYKMITTFFEEQTLVISANENWKKMSTDDSAKPEKCSLTHLKCTSTSMYHKHLLKMIAKIRSCRSSNDGMILYMCRNGATYSGMACIISLLLDRVDNDQCVSVPLSVGTIKSIRPQVISKKDQYQTLYEVLKWYIETSSSYTNIQGGEIS